MKKTKKFFLPENCAFWLPQRSYFYSRENLKFWNTLNNALNVLMQGMTWALSEVYVRCGVHKKTITIGGSSGRRRRAPPRVQILSFWHTNFLKRSCLGSWRPPYGKSWIRHWLHRLRVSTIKWNQINGHRFKIKLFELPYIKYELAPTGKLWMKFFL